MNRIQQDKEMLTMFTARWKTLQVCYDTTEEDVQSLRRNIEDFVKGNDNAPIEYLMLLNEIEDWLVAKMEEECYAGESFSLTEDDVYRKIAQSAFEKVKKEWQDGECDEDEKEVWLLEIFNMMTYINDGDSCEIVAHKIFNEFLQIGCEVELDELLNMVNHLGLSCQQELLSIKIAENAFELGASPEIVLARVREILS